MAPLPLPNMTKCTPLLSLSARFRAFTLIELLAVIAIIGILAGIIIVTVGNVRRSALNAECMSHVRELGVATILASQDNKGKFPAMRVFSWENSTYPYFGPKLRPYLSMSAANGKAADLFRCPVLDAQGLTGGAADFLLADTYAHYRYNTLTAPNSFNPVNPSRAVILFDCVWPNWSGDSWAHEPGDGAFMNVGYADGHVDRMSRVTYQALANGSDAATSNFYTTGWTK